MSCGVVKLEPRTGHERHTHPESDEMLYVVRGEGQQESGDETQEISASDCLSARHRPPNPLLTPF